jgi:hypothetical protein
LPFRNQLRLRRQSLLVLFPVLGGSRLPPRLQVLSLVSAGFYVVGRGVLLQWPQT